MVCGFSRYAASAIAELGVIAGENSMRAASSARLAYSSGVVWEARQLSRNTRLSLW
jgi:hypothetical protein